MAKQFDEDALKRQARRRLIGATVLATVVVAVLPMLLDSEPKSVVKDIELHIPDKDKAGEFVPKVALPPVTAPAAVAPASAVAAPAAPAAPVAVVASVSAPVAETSQQPASRPMQTQSVANEQKAAPARAEAEQKEQAARQAGFIVQIGAFSNTDTAHRWQKNLVKQGVKAYTEKAGDKLRVRAGPYATREAAEKVRHRLESQGLHPNIIVPD